MKKFFRAKLFVFLLSLVCILGILPSFSACKKSVNYFSYVSELRDNIFLAETDEYFLRAYSVVKESPYLADGIVMESSRRIEIYLVAPQGDKNCAISFSVGEKSYGGEMSFDNVKTEYYLSCTLDVSFLREINFSITYGEKNVLLKACSVLNGKELSAKSILNGLRQESPEPFVALTDKYGFAGEIYIRLIYEENPYYYVGIIDRNGKIYAFLVNAITGKTLAKRET